MSRYITYAKKKIDMNENNPCMNCKLMRVKCDCFDPLNYYDYPKYSFDILPVEKTIDFYEQSGKGKKVLIKILSTLDNPHKIIKFRDYIIREKLDLFRALPIYLEYENKRFEEPSKKLIECLKLIDGKIYGSFPLSMLTKKFKATNINIYFDDPVSHADATKILAEHGGNYEYTSDPDLNILYGVAYSFENYIIYLIAPLYGTKETVSFFDFDCCKINWDPKLENPFENNSYNRLRRTQLGITYLNTLSRTSKERYIRYHYRGMKIIEIDWLDLEEISNILTRRDIRLLTNNYRERIRPFL